MKRTIPVILVLLLFTIPITAAASSNYLIHGLVKRMTDPQLSWPLRRNAEAALTHQTDRLAVLKALIPAIDRIGPAHAMYPGLSDPNENAKFMPPTAQISYAIGRVFRYCAANLGPEAGKELLSLLPLAKTDYARDLIINELSFRYVPEAEPTLRLILFDPKQEPYDREQAARILLENNPAKYIQVVFDLMEASTSSFELRSYLFRDTVLKRLNPTPELTRRYAKIGFGLIKEDIARDPNYKHAGYFIAVRMEGEWGLGVKFSPDPSNPKYNGSGNLTEDYFADTVKNALKWWEENKDRL